MKKILLLTAGFVSLALGAVGAVLPVLPTTPFVLLAAACFGSSSPKLYDRLLKTKYFGEFIENYRTKRGVSRSVKIKALIFLWGVLALSAFFSKKVYLALILLGVGICVSIHIILIKTRSYESVPYSPEQASE